VPRLVAAGHEVVAQVRSPAKRAVVEAAGARAVVADPLDRAAFSAAIRAAAPEAVISQLTALSGPVDLKHFDRSFALTNRLRTEAGDTLLAAAREAGVRRVLVQSYCGWPFARRGGPVKQEDDPLDPDPPPAFRRTLAAIRHLEAAVGAAADIGAVALRYGFLYGPGTSIAREGEIAGTLRRRALPIVGNGGGIWSFTHIEDAAAAAVLLLGRGAPGIYQIVDDEPAPVSDWLPFLAGCVGAPPPRRVPALIARLAIGGGGVSMMTRIRGASNAKAKRDLHWHPIWPSWRRGFREGLG
jgi:nucleoside-diphosphate-sugar epimerase